jgi:thiol-disulfide isomerase/thioredoxin
MTEPAALGGDRGSRWRGLLSLAAIVGITALTFGADLLMSDQAAPPDLPRQLPALGREDAPVPVFGASFRLTVIRFWSSTCEPCQAEIAETRVLAGEIPDVRFVAVAVDEDQAAAAAWLNTLGPPVIAVSDAERALASALAVAAVPATVIVDRDRSVVRRFDAADAVTLRSSLSEGDADGVRQRVGGYSGSR